MIFGYVVEINILKNFFLYMQLSIDHSFQGIRKKPSIPLQWILSITMRA